MTGETWIDVMAAEDIDEFFPEGVTVNGKYLAIYKCNGGYFATDGYCSHEDAKLCDGYLDGGIIECPLHHARFEVATGRVLSEPATRNLGVYPVEVRDGRIHVKMEGSQEARDAS